MRTRVTVVLGMALALLCTAPAIAADRYVAPPATYGGNGSDTKTVNGSPVTNDCLDTAAPCATFNRAYQASACDDVVLVGPGSYPSQIIGSKSITCASDQSTNITYRPSDAVPTLGTAGAKINCLGFDGSKYVTVEDMATLTTYAPNGDPSQCSVAVGRNGAKYITIDNVDAGHVWVAADNTTVKNSDLGPVVIGYVSGLAAVAISVINTSTNEPAENVVFDNNVIHDFYSISPSSDHPQCTAPWNGQNVTWSNNTFRNCQTFHFWMSGSANSVGALALGPYTIVGNTFEQTNTAKYGCTGSQIKFGDHGGEIVDTVFRDNRIVMSCGLSLAHGSGGGFGNITIEDNDLSSNLNITDGVGTDSCMTSTSFTRNYGGITADPDYVAYTCSNNRLWADGDGDLVHNADDNCPNDSNPGQADSDLDGLGDACDPFIPGLWGWNALQPEEDWSHPGEALAFQAPADQFMENGSVDTLRIYSPEWQEGGSTELELALYSNNSVHPGDLIAKCTVEPVVEEAWNECSITPVELTGSVYWLSVLAPEGTGEGEFLDNCCGVGDSVARASDEDSLATHPAQWTSSSWSRMDGPVSFYAVG